MMSARSVRLGLEMLRGRRVSWLRNLCLSGVCHAVALRGGLVRFRMAVESECSQKRGAAKTFLLESFGPRPSPQGALHRTRATFVLVCVENTFAQLSWNRNTPNLHRSGGLIHIRKRRVWQRCGVPAGTRPGHAAAAMTT